MTFDAIRPEPAQRLWFAYANILIGHRTVESLPALATEALVEGLDTPAVRELAGMTAREASEALPVLASALDDLNMKLPSREEATWNWVLDTAAGMVDGRVTPVAGSRAIWWRGWENLERPESLTPFVLLAGDWEELPDQRPEIETEMLAAARQLLANEWLARLGDPVAQWIDAAFPQYPDDQAAAELWEDLAILDAEAAGHFRSDYAKDELVRLLMPIQAQLREVMAALKLCLPDSGGPIDEYAALFDEALCSVG